MCRDLACGLRAFLVVVGFHAERDGAGLPVKRFFGLAERHGQRIVRACRAVVVRSLRDIERDGAGERDDAPVLAIAFRHDGRTEAHDFRAFVVAEQERVFDAAMGIAVSLLPQS